MVCDVCGKNQATVHLTEIIDDQMTELHLCEECARQKSAQMESQFGLGDLMAGLTDFEKPEKGKEVITAKCPNCGLSYADFKKMGRLGCGACYGAFKKYLGPLLKKIHGSSVHFGKTPLKAAAAAVKVNKKKMGAQELRQALQMAVENEEFEEAAKIRDQLKELEQKQSPGDNAKKEEK